MNLLTKIMPLTAALQAAAQAEAEENLRRPDAPRSSLPRSHGTPSRECGTMAAPQVPRLLPPPRPLKALSLHQPWADAVARGKKRWETRSWPTTYRGPLVIHATRNWRPGGALSENLTAAIYDSDDWGQIYADQVTGGIVAIVKVRECLPAASVGEALEYAARCDPSKHVRDSTALELELGDYSPGRWAWYLELLHPIDNLGLGLIRGRQRIFNLPPDVSYEIINACSKVGTLL